MNFFFTLFVLFLDVCWAQRIEVSWSDSFRKEVRITCGADDLFCEEICSSASACFLEEGLCRNCIGTGLQMHHLFSELGRSIRSAEVVTSREVAAFLRAGNFVTIMGQDAFNIIDAHNSLESYRKFESLCPSGSLNQILLFRTDPETRKLLRPEYVYCEFQEKELFLRVEDRILIERGLKIPLHGIF